MTVHLVGASTAGDVAAAVDAALDAVGIRLDEGMPPATGGDVSGVVGAVATYVEVCPVLTDCEARTRNRAALKSRSGR